MLAIVAALAIVCGVLVGVSVNSPGSLFNLAGGAQCEPGEQQGGNNQGNDDQGNDNQGNDQDQGGQDQGDQGDQNQGGQDQGDQGDQNQGGQDQGDQGDQDQGGQDQGDQGGGWNDQQGDQGDQNQGDQGGGWNDQQGDQGDQNQGDQGGSWDQQSSVTRHLPSTPEERQPGNEQSQNSQRQQRSQQQSDRSDSQQEQSSERRQQRGGQDQDADRDEQRSSQQSRGSWRYNNQGNQGNNNQGGQEQGQSEECEQEEGEEEEEAPQNLPIGPVAADFIDIQDVRPNVDPDEAGLNTTKGTFISECGESDHQNNDNLVLAPGVENGAHHLHDLIGNVTTNFASTNESLAAGGTSCENPEDQTAYYWPVMRDRTPGDADGQFSVEDENNLGEVNVPVRAVMQWRAATNDDVTPAPRFLRMPTGDAKPLTNGLGNTRPTFTCTGFEERITNKYPVCPNGSQLLRVIDFPSCWDGQNIDSADHRSHVVFPENGSCPAGTQPIPQLRMLLTHEVENEPLSFAVDGFFDQAHKPESDHAGLVVVMSDNLMNQVVECINEGRNCVNSADNQTQRRGNRTNRTKSWRR